MGDLRGQPGDRIGEASPQVADVDPDRPKLRSAEPQACEEPGERRPGSGGQNHPGAADSGLARLLVELGRRADVAETTTPRIAPDGDELVRADEKPGGGVAEPDRLLDGEHGPGRPAERNEVEAGPGTGRGKGVAVEGARPALEVDRVSGHPQPAGRLGGQPHVVRLQGAEGRHPPGALALGPGKEVLEAPDLVPADEVVALDEDVSPELPAQGRQVPERCGPLGEREARKRLEPALEGAAHASRCAARRFPSATIVTTVGRPSASGKTLASHT